MAKFPNVLDYGNRPSLRSNRIDMPGSENEILGDALANAAGVVVDLVTQKTERDNRLEFALAKNELIKADIEEREKLKDREDHEAFDPDYTEAYTGRSDTILAEHKLTGSDRALLSAESDLIRERGRVYAGDLARGVYHGLVRSDIAQAHVDSLKNLGMAPPEEQNEIIDNFLEMVQGAMEIGAIADDDGVNAMQAFVTAGSTQALEDMDADVRLAELELSRAYQKKNGAVDRDSILAGGGSGSIADFLPLHELNKMIKATEDELEVDLMQDVANAANDAAWEAFKDPAQWKERELFIRDFEGMTAKARKEANILNEQERNKYISNDAYNRQQTRQTLANALYASDGTAQLDPGMLTSLLPAERASVEALQRLLRENKEFADQTKWYAYEYWDNMSLEDKANWNSNDEFEITDAEGNKQSIQWRTEIHADRARQMSAESTAARNARGSGGVEDGSLTDTQLLHDTLIATTTLFPDGKPTAASNTDDQQRWAQISLKFHDELLREGRDGKVTHKRRQEILTEVLAKHVLLDEFGRDPVVPGVSVLPEQLEDRYLPITEPYDFNGVMVHPNVNKLRIPDDLGGGEVVPVPWIINMYKSSHPNSLEPNEDTIKHIWAIIASEDFYAAAARIAEMAEKKQGHAPSGREYDIKTPAAL